MNEEESFEYVKGTLKEEHLLPFSEHELKVLSNVEQCINCGICLNHCPVIRAVGVERFTGPRGIAVELSRSPPEFWSTMDRIYLCTGCGTCREVCPNNVDIPNVVNLIRKRIFAQRPDLVPEKLLEQNEILQAHNLAFVPWEDPEEKAESRDMRLERLGLQYVEDKVKESAEILFYPGCQAEERSQEIREAAKIILEKFSIDYTLLKNLTCCSLPSLLIGDEEKSYDLSSLLKQQIDALGVKMIVTTCAGCTSNLNEIAERDGWNIITKHLLEFLIEDIGLEKVAAHMKASEEYLTRVTVHDPCHLIRHTSRRIIDSAHELLKAMPQIEVIESKAHDSCCGGGGMVGRHSPSIARSIVKENLIAIEATSAQRVVTPCPLCTAQLEENLYRSGTPVEVEDLTVFIARHLR